MDQRRSPGAGDAGQDPQVETIGQQHLVVIDYVFIVLKHWKVVLAGLAVCLGAGVLLYYRSTPVYEASSELLVEVAATPSIADMRAVTADYGNDRMATEVSLISSDEVLRGALKLVQSRGRTYKGVSAGALKKLSVKEMKARLEAEHLRRTNLITVRYRCGDPELARDIVEDITTAYGDQFRARMQRGASRVLSWVREQLPRVQKELEDAQKTRIDFQKKLGILSLGSAEESMPVEISLVHALRREVADMEREIADYRSKINALENLGENMEGAMSLPWIRSDQVMAGLVKHEKELGENLAGMLSRLGPNHQDVVEAAARLKQVQSEKQNALKELKQAYSAEIAALETKLKDTGRRLGAVEEKANGLAAKTTELESYRRAEEDARERHEGLLKQFSEVDLTKTFEAGRVMVVNPARAAEKPLWPNLPKILAGMTLLGLVLGLLGAFFWESMDDSVKSGEDVNYIWRMPVLGLIPHISEPEKPGLSQEMMSSHRTEIEAFRMLALSLDLVTGKQKEDGKASVVMISSAGPREGKSMILFYLSVTLALANKKVVAIDADLRRRGYTKLAGLTEADGLAKWFRSGGSIDEYKCKLSGEVPEGLDILPAGHWDKSPTLMLRQAAFGELVEGMRKDYDYVLIDVPPLSFVSDALVVTRIAPMILVVARMGVTSKRLLRRSKDVVHTAGLVPIGSVINEFDSPGVRYGYYYRYYGYYYPYSSYYTEAEDEEEDNGKGSRRSGRGAAQG